MLLGRILFLEFDVDYINIGNFSISLESINNFLMKSIKIICILILMYLAIKIGNAIIDKIVEKQIESNLKFTMDKKKANTIGTLLKSVVKYGVYFIGITTILSNLFGNISWAFASVGGVAIGLGAQSIVKDLINGVFILFEDQYGVGDLVTIGQYQGIVESIGMRSTVLKALSGDYHIIPNGTVASVTNHSKGNIRVNVDVEIAYEESIDNAIKIINEACKNYANENKNVVEVPNVLGINSLNASGVSIRVSGSAKPMTQWEVERGIRRAIKISLDENQIEIPYPKTQILK